MPVPLAASAAGIVWCTTARVTGVFDYSTHKHTTRGHTSRLNSTLTLFCVHTLMHNGFVTMNLYLVFYHVANRMERSSMFRVTNKPLKGWVYLLYNKSNECVKYLLGEILYRGIGISYFDFDCRF